MASGDNPDTNPKPKPRGRKAERLSQEEQSARFKEAARELGLDEDGRDFAAAFQKIVATRAPRKS